MIEWKTYKLSEIAQMIGGGTPKTTVEEYWNGDIPWLSVVDFGKSGKTVYKTEKTITEKGLKESSTKILKKGQLIISARGTVGELAMLGKDMAFNQSCYGLTATKETTNEFLYYLVKDSVGKIKQNTHGAVFDTITKQTFENIEVTIPASLETQTQIAQILTSLDDKIELNLQMNQTLEAMAQALFKEWFVNFNFPNFNGELENGLPKGWRMGKVGEILQPKRGRNITKAEAIEGVFPVVAGGLEPSCYHNESNTQEPVITISSSGANAGFVRLYQMPVWSADSCFIDSSIFPFVHYIYIFLKSNQKNIYDSQEGSAQPHIYPRHIMDLNICVGNESVVQQFEEIVTPLFEKIKYNSLQIQSLTQTRDTLLPKLMTGKIEIRN